MIRLVDGLDASHGFGQRQSPGIDVEPLPHQFRHRAQPARDPGRTDVAEGRHRFREHARVELPWLAVDVEIGAREIRRQHRRAECYGAAEKLLDVAILRPANGVAVEPRHGEEARGIVAAAMRRIEQERYALPGARSDFEGWYDRKILGCRLQFERTRKQHCIMTQNCHLAPGMSSISASPKGCLKW